MSTEAQHAEIVPALIPTTIAEYSKTAAGIAGLRAKYEGARYDCTTKEGDALAREGRSELRTLRVNLEKERERLKKPHLERGRAIDGEAKTLTAAIEALELPIDEQIKAVERVKQAEKEAKEKAERERAAAIAKRIETFRAWPLGCIGKDSAIIATAVSMAETVDLSDMEPADRQLASEVLAASIAAMKDAGARALSQEQEAARLAAERVELDRAKAEQEALLAEQRRIADEEVRAERERDNLARAEADRIAKEERDRLDAEREARIAAEDAARAAEADRIEVERAEARARIAAETAELDRKIAEQRAEENERERARHEAEIASVREAEAQAIASAPLIDAAKDALSMLADLDQEETLTFRTLAAAIERAEGSAS